MRGSTWWRWMGSCLVEPHHQSSRCPKDGDMSYFENIKTNHFLDEIFEEYEIVGTVITSKTQFTNPVRTGDLTLLAFFFWQVLSTNILQKVGHLKKLSTFEVYTLWRTLSFRSLSFHILNHMFQYRNNRKVCLPCGWLLTIFFFHARGNMSQRLTFILTPKMLNHNIFFYKLVLRENNKRKINEPSTSRSPPEEPTPQKENLADNEDFWANLHIEEEEPKREDQTPQEGATNPLCKTKAWAALDALSKRVDHMALVWRKWGGTKWSFIWDLGAHFGVPIGDYSFFYPFPSQFIIRPLPERGDDEA